jgi:hypothetical protein
MEKRLVLALVLTGLVVVGTQFLFRPTVPPRQATDTTTFRDTTAAVTPPPTVAEQAPAAQPAAGVAQAAPRRDSLAAEAPAVRPETTVVADSLAEYRFSNVGAALRRT